MAGGITDAYIITQGERGTFIQGAKVSRPRMLCAKFKNADEFRALFVGPSDQVAIAAEHLAPLRIQGVTIFTKDQLKEKHK